MVALRSLGLLSAWARNGLGQASLTMELPHASVRSLSELMQPLPSVANPMSAQKAVALVIERHDKKGGHEG